MIFKRYRFWLLFILIAFCVFFSSLNLEKINIEHIKELIDSLGFWGPFAYVVFFVVRPIVLIPFNIACAVAGMIWGVGFGFFYLQIAINISSTIEFFIARYLARDFISRHLKGKILDLDEKIAKHGFLTVFLIRIIPNVAWDIQNISLGLTKVKFRDYFLASLLGILPGSFLFMFFGSSIIPLVFNVRNLVIAFGIVFIFLLVFYLVKHKNKLGAQKKST